MKMRWKKIVAILGAVTMMGSMLPVQANELPADPETVEETAETGPEAGEESTETVAPLSTEVPLSTEAAETEESDGLQPVTDLGWSEETPGRAVFYNPNEGNVRYKLYLFRDGTTVLLWSDSSSAAGTVSICTDFSIGQSGTYTYQVEVFPYGEEEDDDLSSGYVSEVSPSFVYTRPDAQVGVPKNITCTSTGLVSWDEVDNACDYGTYLYYADDSDRTGYRFVIGNTVGVFYGRETLSDDYSDYLASGYDYYVRVRAYSSNINQYANGDYSDYIPVNATSASDSVNGELGDSMDDLTVETAKDAVAAVKEAYADAEKKKELQVAMQTDEDTQSMISELEEKYQEALGGVTTGFNPGDTGIDTSGMKLLGAALNATESGKITFNMSKADEETRKDLLTNTRYTNAIVLDFDLEGAGISKGQALDIPVTVTMPVPEGMNPSAMTVLHYNADGTYETLLVRQNSDGTISFTVTHFSYFAFVESGTSSSDGDTDNGNTGNSDTNNKGTGSSTDSSKTNSGNTGSNSTGSGNTGSGSGSSSSSSSISVVAPWKPTTPDEIKRYSVVGKEKPVFTVNAADSYNVTVINAMQGKLCFDSFEAVLGDHTIGRTYNILPSGKMVYTMDKKARITLNIPKDLQKDNRTFKMICVTQKGLPVVLNDLDTDPNTITFETDTYYAFALVYKDITASK